MTLEKLIEEKAKRLEEIPTRLLTILEKKQKEILNDILEKINDLSVKNGAYEITSENLLTVSNISDELKSVLLSEDYLKAVKEFAREFDKQAVLNDKIFYETFGTIETPVAATTYINIAKKAAIEMLVGAPMDTEFIKPIQSLLEQAVVNGATYKDTLSSIQDFIDGGEGKVSQLQKYAKQITYDSFAIADASYTSIVSDALGNDWFGYSGTVVAKTRCFCKERFGGFFYYKEIESWARGENLGACDLGDGQWAGEIDGTNEATIYSFRGGYNCLHFFIPISEAIVPEEYLQRARNLGYIE